MTLRAVPDGAKASPRRRSPRTTKPTKTVTEAASAGTTRELLVAMRTRVATAVEDPKTPARDLASLTKKLLEIVREIETIDAREKQEAGRGAEATDGTFDASAL